ncbi:MAG: biotin transporter BioY [Geodermatophilaceae bacterium]|nr:biotin transporter BioY [Geodermatophilaceae bacterium]MDQ3456239.1 biotin transporter BioY [Actinomycetota bacterium]
MTALSTRELARVAVFAALIAVLGLPGQLLLTGNAVPVTLQTLGVMLAGALLGPRLGALAVLSFLALVAAGLPLLAGGRGGLGVFTGPSAGYLVGFVAGATVIGLIVRAGGQRYRPALGLAANVIGGMAVIYAIGIPVQAWLTGTSSLAATAYAAAVYLPGDAIKAVVATVVAAGVHRAYPQLLRR